MTRDAQKKITLLGMSGVGKTYLGRQMASWGWTHYSCDLMIGAKYLSSHLGGPVTAANLSVLSAFIGKPGDPARGGLDLAVFKNRQKLYYDAECAALEAAITESQNIPGHFVNDSTGSLCEITNDNLIARLGQGTLFVYIEATPEEERILRDRAITHPKPLFYPPARFDEWLADYMKEKNINSVDMVDPDGFVRWAFPRLLDSRLPKYRELAKRYGVTISSDKIKNIKIENDFSKILSQALDEKEHR